MSIGRFRDEQHRHHRAIIICYKFYRRRGYDRQDALERGIAKHNRLMGMVAVMDASGWKADPILVAYNASQC
jgi:hypothetical protein